MSWSTLLPVVTMETGYRFAREELSTGQEDFVTKYLDSFCDENPVLANWVTIVADSSPNHAVQIMGTAVMVYQLLRAQAEADAKSEVSTRDSN